MSTPVTDLPFRLNRPLTKEQREKKIRIMHGQGISYKQIGKKFGLSTTTVGKIVRGEKG